MYTETNCSICSPKPQESHLTTISGVLGSRICKCNSCGSYWIHNEDGWDLLLSSQEETAVKKHYRMAI